MQLDRDPRTGIYIRSFQQGLLRLADREISLPVILSATDVITDWSPPAVADLSIDDLSWVLEQRPELLLLGTGHRLSFPAPQLGVEIMRAGIGFEVMDTRAACRTFNVLVNEGRDVLAALLPDPA